MNRETGPKARWYHGLITLLLLIGVMLWITVGLGGTPLLPLIAGCAVASAVCAVIGFRWEEILGFMIDGIVPSLEAVLILMLIGGLSGVWILSGTVPALIYYGLCILNARWFFVVSALICAVVSFALGAWGTVGTVGIALVGVGTALGLPLPIVAGSVVSGAYFGDALSPLSDATNFTAAVSGLKVTSVVKDRVVPVLCSFALGLAVFFLFGLLHSAPAPESGRIAGMVEPLKAALAQAYHISPLCVLPLAVLVAGIVLKIPAIPSILLGIISGALIALFGQHAGGGALIAALSSGNVSRTGTALIDSLLTAGGISPMMDTIAVVIAATAFGGLMQKSGLIRALVSPLLGRLKGFGLLNGTAALSCLLVNIALPDQYLGICVPGQLFAEEYDKRGCGRTLLSTALTAAALTSPLVPWNTCGLFCASMLGVSAAEYLPYASFNLIGLAAVVLLGFLRAGRRKR